MHIKLKCPRFGFQIEYHVSTPKWAKSNRQITSERSIGSSANGSELLLNVEFIAVRSDFLELKAADFRVYISNFQIEILKNEVPTSIATVYCVQNRF